MNNAEPVVGPSDDLEADRVEEIVYLLERLKHFDDYIERIYAAIGVNPDLDATPHIRKLHVDKNYWQAQNAILRKRITLQRKELRRLNKTLGPFWAGFRKGLVVEEAVRLRGIMNATFGHEKVRAAEMAAIEKKHEV